MSERDAEQVEWRDVGPEFGLSMPHGSCNAAFGNTVCGFPRRTDGTCMNGHPTPPNWIDPALEEDDDA